MSAAAFRARMVADPVLVALLGTYRDEPAVLVADLGALPEDVPRPFVVIDGAELNEPYDTKTEDGRELARPIRCYDDATGSTLQIEAIAERIRWLFHRKPIGLLEGAFICVCSGPIVAPTDSTFYGREITPRITSLAAPTVDDPES